jgi:hypothetical protein
VKDLVYDAWEKQAALKLAKQDAEKKMSEAEGKESLQAVFGDKVIATKEFSWLTGSPTPYGYDYQSLSTVEGVELPGSGFMEKVFSLKEGELGFAVNQPETVVYVIRLAQEVTSIADRRQQFLETGLNRNIRNTAYAARGSLLSGFVNDLEKEMRVHWHPQSSAESAEE